MFAVIAHGGKQYRVEPGDVLQIERSAEWAPSEDRSLELSDVRAAGEGAEVAFGTPLVDGAKVKATVIREVRGPKILVFRKKKRKHYKKRRGHRQDLLEIRIDEIVGAAAAPSRGASEGGDPPAVDA